MTETKMTESELLELAAKAIGKPWPQNISGFAMQYEGIRPWNPIHDDRDNAQLEAKLGIDTQWNLYGVVVHPRIPADPNREIIYERYMNHNNDKQAARRLASVRAAAMVGKAMP